MEKSGSRTHVSPPYEGDGAWAREPGGRGDRRRPRVDFTTSLRFDAQSVVVLFGQLAQTPRFPFRLAYEHYNVGRNCHVTQSSTRVLNTSTAKESCDVPSRYPWDR